MPEPEQEAEATPTLPATALVMYLTRDEIVQFWSDISDLLDEYPTEPFSGPADQKYIDVQHDFTGGEKIVIKMVPVSLPARRLRCVLGQEVPRKPVVPTTP